ncbi:MAG: CBS domain-containing protein [bacterium]|nr:CBS domain-containing protein [bacterium]
MMEAKQVRDLMSEDVYSAYPDDELAVLCDLMARRHVRHMPVVDLRGELVGLVSQRDLLRHQIVEHDGGLSLAARSALAHLRVRHLMTTGVQTAGPDTDIRVAAQIMFKHKYGCLPIVDRGRLVGILTEADFVRLLA